MRTTDLDLRAGESLLAGGERVLDQGALVDVQPATLGCIERAAVCGATGNNPERQLPPLGAQVPKRGVDRPQRKRRDRADGGRMGRPPGPYVRLTVSDNGEGMDAETVRKATEPFFSTKGLGKGTGLGLSMIHGLANQMNGALRLKSELGQGTTAELWLPVTAVAVDIRQTQDVPRVKDADEHGITVLVVDDDALIAMSTVEMLEDLGHEAVNGGSPARALEILKNGQHVDLLITDYSMPRMN